MEDWVAFDRSFRDIESLLLRLSDGDDAPSTINVLSGDIHFGFLARVLRRDGRAMGSRVHQIVSSPIRNVLHPAQRRVLGFGASKLGRKLGGRLQRWSGREASALAWEFEHAPLFANNIGLARFSGDTATLQLLRADGSDGDAGLVPAIEAVL